MRMCVASIFIPCDTIISLSLSLSLSLSCEVDKLGKTIYLSRGGDSHASRLCFATSTWEEVKTEGRGETKGGVWGVDTV